MAYTFNSNIVSDLHKDARGFRPTEYWWDQWDQCGDDNRQAMWDSLCRELEETMAEDARREAQALENFKAQIKEMRKLGAETTRQAIKCGADYVAYHFGMSYRNPYRAVIQECCDQAIAVIEQEEE